MSFAMCSTMMSLLYVNYYVFWYDYCNVFWYVYHYVFCMTIVEENLLPSHHGIKKYLSSLSHAYHRLFRLADSSWHHVTSSNHRLYRFAKTSWYHKVSHVTVYFGLTYHQGITHYLISPSIMASYNISYYHLCRLNKVSWFVNYPSWSSISYRCLCRLDQVSRFIKCLNSPSISVRQKWHVPMQALCQLSPWRLYVTSVMPKLAIHRHKTVPKQAICQLSPWRHCYRKTDIARAGNMST